MLILRILQYIHSVKSLAFLEFENISNFRSDTMYKSHGGFRQTVEALMLRPLKIDPTVWHS
jgi:hypothetical protein